MKEINWVRNIAVMVMLSLLLIMLGGCSIPDILMPQKGEDTEKMSISLGGTVTCYAEPDRASDILATFHNGLQVEYDEIITIQGLQWVQCEHGWVVIAGEESSEEAEPQAAFIRAKLLNVRSAPGESSKQVAQLPKGTFVNVYEIVRADDGRWARVDQGWVYLKHVYFPGEEGNITGFAVVRDNGAKVSTRILESGETVEKLKAGKRVAFLEKLEMKNGDVWIYANDGWINGDDVYIEGDEGKRPCSGIVVDSTPLNVRQGPGTNYEIITSLPYGTYVEVIERINRGKYDWGYIGNGWIYMEHVELEATADNFIAES